MGSIIEGMDQNYTPLVSIIVITYNSSKYVLETLESAKAQTYPNIELIVSDDCSTDDTVEICRNWMEENKERFVRTELITVGENTGVAINCNRGLYAAKGEWLKYIAGDDILLPHALYSYLNYLQDHPDAQVIVSDIQFMGNRNDVCRLDKRFAKLSAKKQLKYLLISA